MFDLDVWRSLLCHLPLRSESFTASVLEGALSQCGQETVTLSEHHSLQLLFLALLSPL